MGKCILIISTKGLGHYILTIVSIIAPEKMSLVERYDEQNKDLYQILEQNIVAFKTFFVNFRLLGPIKLQTLD